MTKLALEPTPRLATLQLRTCPLRVQPLGRVPMVRPPGSVSLTVTAAMVAALPWLVTVSV